MIHRPFTNNTGARSQRGFALVVVMIALALITVLTVLFMANVGRERRGTDLYSRGSEARHLADTAVNLVMGQISAATKEGSSSDPGEPTTPTAWASQPGMIRTYSASGGLSKVYKLYSWDKLVEEANSGVKYNPNDAGQLPPSSWPDSAARFTDLNAPANGVYPIADPYSNFTTCENKQVPLDTDRL